MSRERPILFNAAMVRANRAGLKWQTRRRIKNPEYYGCPTGDCPHSQQAQCDESMRAEAPWRVGDTLWVRESGWEPCAPSWHQFRDGADTWPKYAYDADGLTENDVDDFKAWGWKRRPSIHMPRWACRNTYTVTGVRAERVRDISEADAIAEGIEVHGTELYEGVIHVFPTARLAYQELYESINGPGSFGRDWVWVIEYDNPARSK